MYNIETDSWSAAPSLNFARDSHSSCVAGHTLAVYGGMGDGEYIK